MHGEDENAEDVQMADHLRPMEELLQIPIVGIEDVIVVPAVLANEFELKIELLNFISNSPFFGLENDDPHSHIKQFYQITRTLKINQVPHDVVKLILFSFSLKGEAETWLKNKPPNCITTWDDLVSKFLNRFYPHSKTRKIRNEITNFQQVFDFFYNGLNQSDQDSLNSATGGNLMTKNTEEALTTIEMEALGNLIATMQTSNFSQPNQPSFQQNQASNQSFTSDVLPSNTVMKPCAEPKAITTMDGLTLDGSYIPHYNFLVYQEGEQESETITEVVEIPSYQSTPLIPPPEIPPLSAPKPKENLEPNPHEPPIAYPTRLQKDKFQALDNPTRLVDHFICSIDIVDSLCDKFHILNNQSSGRTNPQFDHSLLDYEVFYFDVGHQKEKSSGSTTSHFDPSLHDYELFHFDVDLKEFVDLLYQGPSIDPPPSVERNDSHHEEFVGEIAYIISPLDYDRFYFDRLDKTFDCKLI
ncbi:reverse transcriptase domain-containing protein [Tanacetum coccineum]